MTGADVDEALEIPPVSLPAEERHGLLEVARAAVAVASRVAPAAVLDAALDGRTWSGRRAAAFVTLTENGDLRGCMGVLDDTRPVQESVAEAAACAARLDPRFWPVGAAELGGLEVEVSVMGPLHRLADPERFRLGVDGIVVERGGRRGLLLPDVAPKLHFDRLEMLDTACRKAGLPPRAWREPGTIVYAFRTDRFGGPALEPAGATPPAAAIRAGA